MDATTAIARYLTAKTAIDARLIGPWNDGETFVLPGGVQGSIWSKWTGDFQEIL